MDEYKSVNRYLNKERKNNDNKNISKRYLLSFIHKTLVSALMFISVLCIIKIDPDAKEVIYKKVYSDNISFSSINSLYNKYFGSILPSDSFLVEPTISVFNESLVYKSEEKFNDGVKLIVDKNYLMPVLESGIVVFVGNKEHYGQTIIIQQVNGIDLWYVNVNIDSIKLYDYVEKGSLLGESINNEVYLYYQKNGEFLDYKEYLP